MTRQILALATSLLLVAPLAGAAEQAPASIAQPVMLETVVVTPSRQYTAAEWQQRQAARQLAAAEAAPVVLEPVFVTPSRRYTLAEWQARDAERRYVASEMRKAQGWLRAVWRTLGLKGRPVEA